MTAKPSKYRNVRTTVDGIIFDSKVEGARYQILKLLEKQGWIKDLELQPSFPLVVNGKRIGRFTADFKYKDFTFFPNKEAIEPDNWVEVVEDVKSPATAKAEAYRLRKKVFEACHGITITEITK